MDINAPTSTVVISQPMFFPWIGMFEQIRLADAYVHYSDVQFSKGSFVNRVQIKTAKGTKWLTVPLEGVSLGQAIDEVRVNGMLDWKRQHLDLLKQAYADAPFVSVMLELVTAVYADHREDIGSLSRASLEAVCRFYGLGSGRRFLNSRDLGVHGAGSQRVLDIIKALNGKRYVTGWGARKYLDHQLFERNGIAVEYMNYEMAPYPQLHGAFTPYVSILDLIANTGENGAAFIRSGTVNWNDFVSYERN